MRRISLSLHHSHYFCCVFGLKLELQKWFVSCAQMTALVSRKWQWIKYSWASRFWMLKCVEWPCFTVLRMRLQVMKTVKNAKQQIFIFEKLSECVMLLPIHFFFNRKWLSINLPAAWVRRYGLMVSGRLDNFFGMNPLRKDDENERSLIDYLWMDLWKVLEGAVTRSITEKHTQPALNFYMRGLLEFRSSRLYYNLFPNPEGETEEEEYCFLMNTDFPLLT